MNGHRLGLGWAALAALLFSFKSVLIKLAYQDGSNPESLLVWRMLFCLPVYALLWFVHSKKGACLPLPWRTVAAAGGAGLVGHGLSSYLDMLGLVHLSAQLERLILFTYPLFVTLLGACFFGIRPSRRAWAAGAVSYLGIALALAPLAGAGDGATGPGVLLVLGAALTYALYQLWAGPLIHAIGATRFTCIAMASSSVFSLGVHAAFAPGQAPAQASAATLAWAAALALFCTVLPSLLLSAALRHIGPQENAAIGASGPALTMLLAAAWLAEPVTLPGVLGCAIAVAASAWLAMSEARAPRSSALVR